MPKFIVLAVVLVILSAALPAYSQALFIKLGVPAGAAQHQAFRGGIVENEELEGLAAEAAGVAPTLANIINILMQVVPGKIFALLITKKGIPFIGPAGLF